MAADQFKDYLKAHKIEDIEVLNADRSTHTAREAADFHNVPVSNIVKSILVTDDKNFIMVLVPGDVRIDFEKVNAILGGEYRMSTPEEAKRVTGYSIGGIPPFGHIENLKTYIYPGFDKSIELIAAGGSSKDTFKVSYDRLVEISKAKVI